MKKTYAKFDGDISFSLRYQKRKGRGISHGARYDDSQREREKERERESERERKRERERERERDRGNNMMHSYSNRLPTIKV